MASMPLLARRGRPGLGHQQPAGKLAGLAQIDQPHDHARHARGDALAVLAAPASRRARARCRAPWRPLPPAARCASVRPRRPRRSGGRRPRSAQVARMRPFSIRANLVVPPPMSTLSSVALCPRESATAPEPCAAIWHSMWWPAEAQTNLPASSENRSAMARALRRLSASPVRMTAPLSTVSRLDPGIGVAAADEAGEIVDVDGVVGPVGREQDRRLPEHLPARPRRSGSTARSRAAAGARARTSDARSTSRCRCRRWSARHCRRPRRPR